jgi:hypothetical protein
MHSIKFLGVGLPGDEAVAEVISFLMGILLLRLLLLLLIPSVIRQLDVLVVVETYQLIEYNHHRHLHQKLPILLYPRRDARASAASPTEDEVAEEISWSIISI